MQHSDLGFSGNDQEAARLQQDLAAINTQMLLLVREVANKNSTQAQTQFGLDSEAVRLISEMDIAAIQRLANMPALVFRPKIPSSFMGPAITAAIDDNPDGLDAVANTMKV